MPVALGIDTGGTYTDAALVEYGTNRVLAHAKALTTKHDLAIGIRGAIERVLAAQPAEVCLVSLSTTLATNAIVEGTGAPVCTLLIGYDGVFEAGTDPAQVLGTQRYGFMVGGHLSDGEEQQPLDLPAAERTILEHAPHVAAFAISGYFGTRNPSHELRVKERVAQLTGLPVTCGHELTHKLDAVRRAITVTLNARLIPPLCDLIGAVQRTLTLHGIEAPLMVVKGDGSLMDVAVAIERPVETILSGPAASVVGAQHLAGGGDVVVVDMGGTTTDIAVLADGSPKLSQQGARVGQWRTMVEAVDVHTVGLGGDSRVWLEPGGGLCVGPRRIVPISLLAYEHPEVLAVLYQQTQRTSKPLPNVGDFLLLQRGVDGRDGEHPGFEDELFSALEEGPCSLERVHAIVQHPELYARYLDGLERWGTVVRAGFTPSDAAHVLGLYTSWNREAALLAARLLAARTGWEAERLCEEVLAHTAQRIATEVVTKFLSDDGCNGQPDPIDSYLIARALQPSGQEPLQCDLTLRSAIVALGAPVRTYFPMVANLLHGTLRIPEHTEAANAVGAVAGSVVHRAYILVVPHEEESAFRVHLPDRVQSFASLDEALHYAENEGRSLAYEGALRAGAEEIRVQVARRDQSAPVWGDWGEEVYLGTTLEVSGTGRPRIAHF